MNATDNQRWRSPSPSTISPRNDCNHCVKSFSCITPCGGHEVQCLLEFPLDDVHKEVDQLAANIINQNGLADCYHDDIRTKLYNFAVSTDDELKVAEGERAIDQFLMTDVDDQRVVQGFSTQAHCDQQETNTLRENFLAIINGDSPSRIKALLHAQENYARDIRAICRERDVQLNRLRQEHDMLVADVHQRHMRDSDDATSTIGQLARRIQHVESQYASELSLACRNQKKEYEQLVARLAKRKKDYNHEPQEEDEQSSVAAITSHYIRDESFTIYLGAQLKSMHNVRITVADRAKQRYDSGEQRRAHTAVPAWRLQSAMTLYSHALHAKVLLVNSANPLMHVLDRSEFARLCEQSTELHFASLDEQLQNVAQLIPCISGVRLSPSNHADDRLRTGDIYLTCHSNLPDMQVGIHICVDDSLALAKEINSRHPCIIALRNTIRTCARYGITHLTLPLLLIDDDTNINNDDSTHWFVRRAELMFKCAKGFLMEVAAYGSTSDITRQQQHYTIQFTLPRRTPSKAYEAIIELFPTIFRLVEAVQA